MDEQTLQRGALSAAEIAAVTATAQEGCGIVAFFQYGDTDQLWKWEGSVVETNRNGLACRWRVHPGKDHDGDVLTSFPGNGSVTWWKVILAIPSEDGVRRIAFTRGAVPQSARTTPAASRAVSPVRVSSSSRTASPAPEDPVVELRQAMTAAVKRLRTDLRGLEARLAARSGDDPVLEAIREAALHAQEAATAAATAVGESNRRLADLEARFERLRARPAPQQTNDAEVDALRTRLAATEDALAALRAEVGAARFRADAATLAQPAAAAAPPPRTPASRDSASEDESDARSARTLMPEVQLYDCTTWDVDEFALEIILMRLERKVRAERVERQLSQKCDTQLTQQLALLREA